MLGLENGPEHRSPPPPLLAAFPRNAQSMIWGELAPATSMPAPVEAVQPSMTQSWIVGEELEQFISIRIAKIKPEKGRSITIAGLIIAIRTMNTKRGDRIAFITLDDKSARVEIALFTEAYAQFGGMLAKDRLVVVEGEASIDDYSGANRMQASFVTDIDGARERYARKLELKLTYESGAELMTQLRSTIEPYCEGITPIQINYQNRGAMARLDLGDEWHIRPSEQLMQRLRQMLGDENVRLDYGKS